METMKQLVRLTKFRESPAPICHAAQWDEFVPGELNTGLLSLPVGYQIEGYFLDPLEVGKPMNVDRISRNGVKVRGTFTSSPVVSIEEDLIETKNSRYKIEQL